MDRPPSPIESPGARIEVILADLFRFEEDSSSREDFFRQLYDIEDAEQRARRRLES